MTLGGALQSDADFIEEAKIALLQDDEVSHEDLPKVQFRVVTGAGRG